MEKKDSEHTPDRSTTNNIINSHGTNYGIIGNSVTITGPKPPGGEPPHPVETAIWKGTVVQLVSAGQMEEALAEILKARPPQDVQTQVTLLAGRFSQLKIEEIAGVLDQEMKFMELNRIRDGILTLISRF